MSATGVPLPARVSHNAIGREVETVRRANRRAQPPLLHHQTAVLHDLDAGLGELLRGLVVADAELEPDALRFRGEDVVDVRRDVAGAAEDVDHVDRAADRGERAEDRFAEDLRDFGVVDGDGDDFVAGAAMCAGT